MARDFNENRNVNARLVSADIDKFGKTFAIQSPYNADGFSSVNVTVEQAPSDIKQYLEGDNSITVYPVPSNIDKLCEYALTSFPNIEDLYLFKTSAIVVLEDDLSYLLDLNKIYVPTDLLSAYQSAYPTLSSKFDIIVEDYTLTIPFVGDTTLTSEYVDSVIAMLSNAEKNAITKVVIPTDFTQESATAVAWGYNFSAIVNLNDNIWYGSTKLYFNKIVLSGYLTQEEVTRQMNKIPQFRLSGIDTIELASNVTYSGGNFPLDVLNNFFGSDKYGQMKLVNRGQIQYQNSGHNSRIYTNFYNETNLFKEIYNYGTILSLNGGIYYLNYVYNEGYLDSNGDNFSPISGAILYNASTTYWACKTARQGVIAYLPNLNTRINKTFGKQKAFYVVASDLTNSEFDGAGGKWFFGSQTITGTTNVYRIYAISNPLRRPILYFRADIFGSIKNNQNIRIDGSFDNTQFGIIDGADVYNNMNDNHGHLTSMNYPKLAGIDTEANIQLLTPTEDVLYLASDTGNLWQYDSANSQWVNLFSGYTPSWYSDEDVTTIISPSSITIDMTVYVKLA